MAATDYDFFLTRNQLIEEAYRKIGLLADGESISSGQLDTGHKKLNTIIKAIGSDGILLFSNYRGTFSTVADQKTYSTPTDNGESFIESLYLVENGTDFKLDRLSTFEYDQILNKDDTGRPYAFTQDLNTEEIHLYLVPSQVYTVKYTAICKLEDWEDPNGQSQFPTRWMSALKYALAVELAEDNKCPLSEIRYLRDIAEFEYRKARGKELDNSDRSNLRGAY